jgi:hypothetical protein
MYSKVKIMDNIHAHKKLQKKNIINSHVLLLKLTNIFLWETFFN